MKAFLIFSILLLIGVVRGQIVNESTEETSEGSTTFEPNILEETSSPVETQTQPSANFTILITGCPSSKMLVDGRCRPRNKVF